MSAERDLERLVRAWIADGPDQLPESYLDAALDEIAVTPQARAGWLLRAFPWLHGTLAPSAVAVVTITMAVIVGFALLQGGDTRPHGGSPPPEPTPVATPVPTAPPTPPGPTLASGRFAAVFGKVDIAVAGIAPEQTGAVANVSGAMEVSLSAQEHFAVDLRCARSEGDGIVLIGGPVTESTHPDVIVGTRVAIILQAGDPAKAILWFEGDTLARTCTAFLRRAPDASGFLEPIDGDLELAP